MKKQTHEKIIEDTVGCGELTAMVTVKQITYISKITEGKCTRDYFL